MKQATKIAAAALALAGVTSAGVVVLMTLAPASGSRALERAEAFYATRRPFERPLAHAEVPRGLPDLSAETCGACHQAIYREWAVSTHRRAWTGDAQFQAELAKSSAHGAEKDGDVGWLCVNCHTPLTNQLPRLAVGLQGGALDRPIYVENPSFDAALQDEAITCAACHVRDGVVEGPRGDSPKAPHPVARAERLTTPEVCVGCHQAEMVYEGQSLACFFSTGREWVDSPAARRGQTCQGCHMPEIERKVAEDYDVRCAARGVTGSAAR